MVGAIMSNGRTILVVEDDFDIANMLRIYFSGQQYEVQIAPRGNDALTMTRKQLPDLIILDIMLPDMNGYDVCRELRTTSRTSHIPIIFLTQKDERSDKIIGLELGADDYITKPFDIEELKLRVQNAIRSVEIQVNRDPKSGLPKGQIIEDELRALMHAEHDWTYIDVKLNNFESFYEVYGFVARDEVKKFMTRLISEVLNEQGTKDDFVGHPADDNFIIITHMGDPDKLKHRLVERFNSDVKQHYSFIDRERGYILVPDPVNGERQESLMTLSTGSVSTKTHQFSDIREIVELAAEDRRRGISGETDTGSRILTSW